MMLRESMRSIHTNTNSIEMPTPITHRISVFCSRNDALVLLSSRFRSNDETPQTFAAAVPAVNWVKPFANSFVCHDGQRGAIYPLPNQNNNSFIPLLPTIESTF